MDLPFGTEAKLLISFLLGAFIGLERESYERKNNERRHPGTRDQVAIGFGVRTFSMITVLGSIAGLLLSTQPVLTAILTGGIILFSVSSYILSTLITRDIGFTTELTFLMSFMMGFLLSAELLSAHLVIALSVILVLILSLKRTIRSFVAGISTPELNALISYGIIALVILPFLPDTSVTLRDIPLLETLFNSYGIITPELYGIELFNPFTLWRVIAIITGVELLGHILERTIGGMKSWLIASFAGGFISSTAVTQALAIRSRKAESAHRLSAAALLANVSSFFQMSILVSTVNLAFFTFSVPFILLHVIAGIIGVIFLSRTGRGVAPTVTDNSVTEKEIFSLYPAIRFALLFVTIKLVTSLARVAFGNVGFFVTAMISALAGLDAIVITLSQQAGSTLSLQTALMAFFLVNAVNLIGKSVYSAINGSKQFAIQFGLGALLMILISAVAILPG